MFPEVAPAFSGSKRSTTTLGNLATPFFLCGGVPGGVDDGDDPEGVFENFMTMGPSSSSSSSSSSRFSFSMRLESARCKVVAWCSVELDPPGDVIVISGSSTRKWSAE